MISADRRKGISFSWDLHYRCNYRCPYCWWHGRWQELAGCHRNLSTNEWLGYWKNIYDKYGAAQIEVVGGEPFIYPDFVNLIEKLSAMHTIRITTNLSTNIDAFLEMINPSRVKINPTFHPTFSDFNTFIKKCIALRDKGFTENVNYLAYPPQIKFIPGYKAKFNRESLALTVMTFWGEYNGKDYPASYTEEEKEIISIALGKRNNQEFQLVPKKMVKGKSCAAGYRYAVIQTDGTVLRCGGSGLNEKIGNFFDENFSLQAAPSACSAEHCKCNEWAELLEDEEKNEAIIAGVEKIKNEKIDVPIPIPRYPRAAYPYKVHWNWEPSYECNYKCSYCSVRVEHAGEKVNYLSVQQWKDIWDKLFDDYGSAHIRFSGGEPFVYPNFIELINMLSEKYTMDVTTNLSFNIEHFLKNVKPGEVSISASFHPDHITFEDFLQKIMILNKNGFPSDIAYVAYPPNLKDLQGYRALCKEFNILLKVIPFQGEYGGKRYPINYTSEEKSLLEEGFHNAADSFQTA